MSGLMRNLPVPSEDILRLCARARRFEDEAEPWLRGLIATDVWRSNPGMPVVLKKAEVLARSLEQIEPIVLPEDGIIGIAFRRLRVHGGIGDEDAWRIRVKNPEQTWFNPEWPVPDEVRRALGWWRESGTSAAIGRRNEARCRHAWLSRYAIAHPHGGVGGHTLPDHGILLAAGIGGLRSRIARRAGREASESERDELRALDRCLEGLSRHARLCADAARRQAARVGDAECRRRLLAASAACTAVAEAPPATFAEALQLLYFSNCADILDNHGDASSFGRIDQLLFPYYEADLRAGRITREEAFDAICRFIAKKWYCQTSNNLTVGGLTPEGTDGVNELSYLFPEAMEATGMVTNISVRLHRDAPDEFLRMVARVLTRGFGRPDVYADEPVIEGLVRSGIALEDARDYAPLGCVEIMIPGRTGHRTMCLGLNLPKVLELVLKEGRCRVTGDRVWDDVPSAYADFAALTAAYRDRIRRVVDASVEVIREDERMEASVNPRPWLTVLSRGGIEAARDLTAGQPAYDPVGVTLDGIADVVNSLVALRHLVYGPQATLTLAGLRAVLDADWQGHEPLRRFVLEQLPRFGTDDPEANAVAREEAAHFASCFAGRETFFGGPFWPMIFGVSTSMLAGASPKTGADPGGRRSGDALAQSLQPAAAGRRGGPTEILNSCAAIDFRDFPGGLSNVQDFDPVLFEGAAGVDRLAALIRSFFGAGGMELSLNLLSEEQLLDAQARPEAYPFLMVRLFGLSARFVQLSPRLQASVIERVRAARG